MSNFYPNDNAILNIANNVSETESIHTYQQFSASGTIIMTDPFDPTIGEFWRKRKAALEALQRIRDLINAGLL